MRRYVRRRSLYGVRPASAEGRQSSASQSCPWFPTPWARSPCQPGECPRELPSGLEEDPDWQPERRLVGEHAGDAA
eukprot:10339631-Alexandrium_andersonii.AAC.1